MLLNKNAFKINNVSLGPYLLQIEFQRNKLWGDDTGRNLKGKTVRNIPILMMSELKEFIKKNRVEIAVLTIPKSNASEVADVLADTSIKGIWNFAHTDLNMPESIIVENVHLSDSLMRLSYRIGHNGESLL